MQSFFEPKVRRRTSPRVSATAFATEHQDDRDRHAMILDLSEDGLRLQRPLVGLMRPQSPIIQLEFEIPEVDEIVWAKGHVCFDEVRRTGPRASSGLRRAMRTSGIQVVAATERHRRLLREYVNDAYRAELLAMDHASPGDWLTRASCYRRG